MINLLPPQQQKELLKEKSFKLVLILGITFLAFLLSLFLILFSIKISIEGKLFVQGAFLSQKEIESAQIKDLEEQIKNLNLTLSNLNSFYQNQISLIETTEKISKALPAKAYLTSLDLDQLGKFSLAGYSPSREILIEFKKNLEEEQRFEDIYFPPSNWVIPNDINFTISFKTR